MKIRRTWSSLLGVILSLLLSGCSSSSPNYLRQDLANIGPVFLSRENPYISANLFVANEANLSSLMDGFISHRGSPDAIEVSEHWFKPLRVYFYYLDSRDAFVFEQGAQDWIIRGPQRIPDDVLTKLKGFAASGRAAAQEGAEDEQVRFREKNLPTEDSQRDAYAYRSSAEQGPPVRRRSQKARPVEGDFGSEDARVEKTDSPPLLLREKHAAHQASAPRQTASAARSHQAVSTIPEKPAPDAFPNDILHQVKYARETLRMIAAWYTDSADNAGRIARINGLSNPNVLEFGQQVRIPGYLLKRIDPMPESAVERYWQNAGGASR